MQTRYAVDRSCHAREVAQRSRWVLSVGTPSELADQMEDYVDQVGGDGFMLSPIYTPGAIEEFVDLVRAGVAAARPLPARLRRHHAARSLDAGALTAVLWRSGPEGGSGKAHNPKVQ